MSKPKAPPARKAVAFTVTVITGWIGLAILFDADHGVSLRELGYLLDGLTAAFLGWYVPNDIPAPWQPRRFDGDAGNGTIDLVIKVALVILLVVAILAITGDLPRR